MNKTLTKTWFLTAGETDARGLMPMRLIAMRAVETATLHSNELGIGYADLLPLGIGWVMARISIQVDRYPRINETYSMSTWIAGYNKYFSERRHEMTGSDGSVLARITSTWAAIDIAKRSMAPLIDLDGRRFPIVERAGDIERLPPPSILADNLESKRIHRFSFSDIDFNRHVNAISYLIAAIDTHGLSFYDGHNISRLDAVFEHESYFDEDIAIVTGKDRRCEGALTTEFHRAEGRRVAAVRLKFQEIK